FVFNFWAGSCVGIQVTIQNDFNVVILFQPIVLKCNYETSSTVLPLVTWKYKSFCRSRIADAFSSSSEQTLINNQLQEANPNYNPYVECTDTGRTIRIVASKQGNTVTLGPYYQGRRITILNNADLSIEQTAWGDSGVYYCHVVSSQDLGGNNEGYAELIVLGRTGESELLPDIEIGNMEDWLFVLLIILCFFFLLMLIGICWCQCCPHTCCCYVRCPCCPEKCCCPRALYEAGKAATAGVPSMYAPSMYAPTIYSQPLTLGKSGPNMMPLVPMQTGYMPDYDGASSGGLGQGSQVPLLHDHDGSNSVSVRSGYRIQANPQDDNMRVLYYVEKELQGFDPARPGNSGNHYEKSAMSDISSLHEDGGARNHLRNGIGRLRSHGMSPIDDLDEEESLLSASSRRTPGRYEDARYRDQDRRMPRAHSMDYLDDLDRRNRDYYRDHRNDERSRGRRGSDDEASSRSYDRRRRDYSPERRNEPYQKRSRSRDDLRDLERTRSPRGGYDDSFLDDVLRRKQQQHRSGSREHLETASDSTPRSGNRRHRRDTDDFPPPPPPPYSETESTSSKGKKLRRLTSHPKDGLVM
uniref:Lipolysis stimulated lipoprotein receptor n=1 Tax=Latimeria chalumnae TaxID=7897 RepID=H3A0D3_LATCH